MRENVRKLRLNYEDLIIALVMLLLIVFFAVLPMRNSSIRHAVVFSGSVLFYGLATVRILRQNLPIGFFFRLVGLFVLILLGILLTVKEYDYEVFYAALNFLALFVLMTTKSNLSFSKESLKIVFFGAIVLTALVTLLSFSSVAYWFEDGRSNGALALGMTNSNVTGVMLSGIISILLFFYFENEKTKRILIFVLVSILVYLLVLTECRSALACSLLSIGYALFFRKIRIPDRVVVLPIIFSILFVPIYLALYDSGLANTIILGKDFFSGRQVTYREFLEKLTNTVQWLLGNYGDVKLSNAHNAPLCIICSLGLVGFSIVYWSFGKRMIEVNRMANSVYSRMVVVCFMSLFVQSSMEALMFTGIFPSIAIIYLYTVFAEIKPEENEDVITQNN